MLIAASSGYKMSVIGHKIMSTLFAIIRSIGVVGTVLNIKNLLDKSGIHIEIHVSDKLKSTIINYEWKYRRKSS